MIRGNATGSDIRLLFTSTIDVSLGTPVHVPCEEADTRLAARLEVTEGWIHRTSVAEWRTQGYVVHVSYPVSLRGN